MDKKTIFLLLLVVFSLKFFDSTFVANTGMLKNACFAFMFFSIILSLPSFLKYRGGFVLPIQLICIAIFLSIFMASYTWGQGLSYSATTIPYAMWFVFFLLLRLNIPIKTVENVIISYGIIYILLFLFQFTHNNVVYFGVIGEFQEDRGVVRVIFPGGGVFFLSSFIAINKITTEAKNRLLWISFAVIALVIVILQVTRQTIFVLALIYLLHFLRNLKFTYKIVAVVAFVLGVYLFLNSNNTISKGLADQQKEDASYGKDYIRLLSAKYYLTEFTPNTISKILGNGFPNDNSNYGKSLISLNQAYGYFLTDVGFIELYTVFGLFAILGMIIIFIKSIIIPLPPEYYFLKYYLWMIILTSLTSDIMINYSFLITTVLVLYCYQRVYAIDFSIRNSKFIPDSISTLLMQ